VSFVDWICRDFSIAPIKHQKARGLKEQVPQMAQRGGIFERSFETQSVSKTACRAGALRRYAGGT